MRVILAEHIADHARALHVGARIDVIAFVHREQNAPMHRLEAVADVRQCTPHDHAHRVIEIGLPHFVFEIDVQYFASDFGHEACLVALFGPGYARVLAQHPRTTSLPNAIAPRIPP